MTAARPNNTAITMHDGGRTRGAMYFSRRPALARLALVYRAWHRASAEANTRPWVNRSPGNSPHPPFPPVPRPFPFLIPSLSHFLSLLEVSLSLSLSRLFNLDPTPFLWVGIPFSFLFSSSSFLRSLFPLILTRSLPPVLFPGSFFPCRPYLASRVTWSPEKLRPMTS